MNEWQFHMMYKSHIVLTSLGDKLKVKTTMFWADSKKLNKEYIFILGCLTAWLFCPNIIFSYQPITKSFVVWGTYSACYVLVSTLIIDTTKSTSLYNVPSKTLRLGIDCGSSLCITKSVFKLIKCLVFLGLKI